MVELKFTTKIEIPSLVGLTKVGGIFVSHMYVALIIYPMYTVNHKSYMRENFPGSSACREKTFVVFASSVLRVLPLLKAFVGKTFTVY